MSLTESSVENSTEPTPSTISRKFKGIWISRGIWLDPNLSATEKVLLAEIDSLSDEACGCFASTQYLADFMGLSTSRVANMLTSLKEKGRIESVVALNGKRELCVLTENTPFSDTRIPPSRIREYPVLVSEKPIHYNKEYSKGEEEPLQIFRKAFPEFTPSVFQQNDIAETVTDVGQWKADVAYWASNGHQPRSVGKLLDMHRRNDEARRDPGVIGMAATPVVTQDPCPYCTGSFGPERCPNIVDGRCTW